MIKVFAFAGSCAGEQSSTVLYADSLAKVFTKAAAEKGEEVSYKRVSGDMLDIKYCRSCVSCFKNGICPLDKLDDMPKLKQDFLDSDIIFFGSPVYLWEMSGITKSVLDRISYWAHTYELAGKIGVVYAVTDNSHAREVAENLGVLLNFTGLTIVKASYAFKSTNKPNLYLEEDMQPEYEEISRLLLEARETPEKFITPFHERTFIGRKKVNLMAEKFAEMLDDTLWYETKTCRERCINDYKTYSEFIIDAVNRVRRNDIS